MLQEIQPQERLLATVQNVNFSFLGMWLEPEICAPNYWKVELMGREGVAGRCEDGQTIYRLQGLVRQISGRVLKVGERQDAVETAGA